MRKLKPFNKIEIFEILLKFKILPNIQCYHNLSDPIKTQSFVFCFLVNEKEHSQE